MLSKKPKAAPLCKKVVNRLQEADQSVHAQGSDDSDVPRHEVTQQVKHVRHAELRRKRDRVERISHGLQCVVGGRSADCVGCSRGADVISNEDDLVPLRWENKSRSRQRAPPTRSPRLTTRLAECERSRGPAPSVALLNSLGGEGGGGVGGVWCVCVCVVRRETQTAFGTFSTWHGYA